MAPECAMQSTIALSLRPSFSLHYLQIADLPLNILAQQIFHFLRFYSFSIRFATATSPQSNSPSCPRSLLYPTSFSFPILLHALLWLLNANPLMSLLRLIRS